MMTPHERARFFAQWAGELADELDPEPSPLVRVTIGDAGAPGAGGEQVGQDFDNQEPQ